MKSSPALALLLLFVLGGSSCAFDTGPSRPSDFRQLKEATALRTSLDRDFDFRKTKQFYLGDVPGAKVQTALFKGPARDPAIGFEQSYRLHGAVTMLDQRRRYGNYFDFFWRAKREANLTVRLEYRQEKLHAFTQAREVDYPHTRGHRHTAFAVIGDDFWNDGRVLAWRCLLIENGRIVAETRSYLWR